jgi:predicted nucleic acid-binding protein
MVFDTSAWHRQERPAVQPRWAATLERGLLVACPVAVLEILAPSRNEQMFEQLDGIFQTFRQAPVTRRACDRALAATRELKGSRRLPATDYLIAAAAAERSFGVLHYDSHFDLLCRAMGIESVPVAPHGTLD